MSVKNKRPTCVGRLLYDSRYDLTVNEHRNYDAAETVKVHDTADKTEDKAYYRHFCEQSDYNTGDRTADDVNGDGDDESSDRI